MSMYAQLVWCPKIRNSLQAGLKSSAEPKIDRQQRTRIQPTTVMDLPSIVWRAFSGMQHRKMPPMARPVTRWSQRKDSSSRRAMATSIAETPKARRPVITRQPQTNARRPASAQRGWPPLPLAPSAFCDGSRWSSTLARLGWSAMTTNSASRTTRTCTWPTSSKRGHRPHRSSACRDAAAKGPRPMASIPEKTQREVCSDRSATGVRCNMLET
mmetsp:Transcript_99809/g.277917  ORF Transcript_99809/g.277917 Transcript_99809/m.277917 type:complete len:213 (+) Transcript_99809:480-1118(+)